MHPQPACPIDLDPVSREFYRKALRMLDDAAIPFLVGGAYSLANYTGIVRHTKDFDIFVLPADCPRILGLFEADGYRTELTFPHWLGKVYSGENFLDVIFSSGNGVARVDEGWFEHSVAAEVLGFPVRLCPAEETIWSKAFVTERERYDGADIAHLLRGRGRQLDWRRLLDRFGPHWRLLLSYLVQFGFIYPGERDAIPDGVMQTLVDRLQLEKGPAPSPERVCQGTLLSRSQYLIDVEDWGYRDARLAPAGNMSTSEVKVWTDAIPEREGSRAECPASEAAASEG